MASCRVVLQPSVRKDLRVLPRDTATRVFNAIQGLAIQPQPKQAVKLSGAERLYRVRVGDYRIVYELDAARRLVTIYHVRHRRGVYRVL